MSHVPSLDHLEAMLRIRVFEESLTELRDNGEVFGTFHPYVGQEAVAVGVCGALDARDVLTSTHRGHGHLIARGARLEAAFAEMLGREDGYCRGRGGSMHIAAVDLGMLGANGIVAGGAPIAVGAAFAAKYRGDDQVAVCFFGDGATGEGVLWESLNLSAVMGLPVVWVCENNGYASQTPISRSLPASEVSSLISDKLMPTMQVDGNSVADVQEVAGEAVKRARSGEGPQFVEAFTFRTLWHSYSVKSKPDQRPIELREQWAARDPIALLERQLRELSLAEQHDIDAVHRKVEAEIRDAIDVARRSPWPSAESVLDNVLDPI